MSWTVERPAWRRGGNAARAASVWAHPPCMNQADTGRDQGALPVGAAHVRGWLRTQAQRAKAAGWFVNRKKRVLPGDQVVQTRTRPHRHCRRCRDERHRHLNGRDRPGASAGQFISFCRPGGSSLVTTAHIACQRLATGLDGCHYKL